MRKTGLWHAAIFITCVLLLLVTVVITVAFTEAGSRTLLNTLSKTTPLEIQHTKGTLLGKLHLSHLRLSNENITLELSDINTELTASCLWSGQLCFKNIAAAQLEVHALPADDVSTDKPDMINKAAVAALIVFPLNIKIEHLSIANTSVHWQGGSWRHGQTRAQVSISGSRIRVNGASIENTFLELHELSFDDKLTGDLPTNNASSAKLVTSNNIALPSIDLPLELVVNQLSLQQLHWDIYGFKFQQQALSLTAHWVNTQLQISQAAINDLPRANVRLKGSLEFIDNWPLTVDTQLELAQPSIWQGLHQRTFDVAVSGDLAALNLNAQLHDNQPINLQGKLNTLDPLLPFELQASAQWSDTLPLRNLPGLPEDLPEELLQSDLLSPVQFSAEGTRHSQSFTLQAAARGLDYKALQLSLQGRHEQSHLFIEQAKLRNIANDPIENSTVQDDAAENRSVADSDLTLSGSLFYDEELKWTLAALSPGFTLPAINQQISGRLAGSLQASGSANKNDWLFTLDKVDLHGDVNGLPAIINGYANIDNDLRITHSKLRAELNNAKLLLIADDSLKQSPQFTLTIDDLSHWHTDAAGSLILASSMSAATQQIVFKGTGQSLQWQNITIGQTSIEGDYNLYGLHAYAPNTAALKPFTLDLHLDNVDLGSSQLRELSIVARGNEQGQSLSVSSHGDIEGTLEFRGKDASAAINNNGGWRGQLLPTQLATPLGQWQLAQPVELNGEAATPQFKIAAHCWQGNNVQLCPGAFILGTEGGGSLELNGDISFLEKLLPTHIAMQGQLLLSLESHWSVEEGPHVQGELTLQSGQIAPSRDEHEPAFLHWDKADANFTLNSQEIQCVANLEQAGNKTISADLKLPRDKDTAIDGKLIFSQLQLYAFKPFLPKLSQLQGQINGTVELSGSTEKALGHGSVHITDGQFAALSNPSEIKAMDLELSLHGDWAELKGKGKMGEGEFNINGKLVSQPELAITLNVEGSQQRILMPPSTTLLVSENINLRAREGLLKLDGQLILHEGLVEFDQLPEGGVALSADAIEVDAQGKPLQQERPFDMAIDLHVAIKNQLAVVGHGLNVLVGGDLHLRQKVQHPLQLFGDLKVLDGEFHAYGQRLAVKRGTVSFTGDLNNPRLNVRAERHVGYEKITVGVEVQGNLATPQLQIYSDPTMPQAEALSYLTRGKGLTRDSGLSNSSDAKGDGTAMALSLGTSIVNQSGLLNPINQLPGLNNITLGTEESATGTRATVSGYIGDKIYLSYGVGLHEPIDVLTTRLYLRTRLWLELVTSLENSLDLYYSFDLD